MTGGTIARCDNCGRLLIHGQRCVCKPRPDGPCDCTHDGNQQHIGPTCQKRINEAWASVLRPQRGNK